MNLYNTHTTSSPCKNGYRRLIVAVLEIFHVHTMNVHVPVWFTRSQTTIKYTPDTSNPFQQCAASQTDKQYKAPKSNKQTNIEKKKNHEIDAGRAVRAKRTMQTITTNIMPTHFRQITHSWPNANTTDE